MPRVDSASAAEELYQLRTTGERQPEKVAALGARLIRDRYESHLGDQLWPTYEQVAIAAFDVGDHDLAEHCIQRLKARFGEQSLRFRRLLGMQFESKDQLDEAQKVYDSILKEDDTNMLASKRQIALLKAQRKEEEAIHSLKEYLDTYYDDTEGWMELCDLYLSKHAYEQASYCCEELLLLQPTNHIYYLKYAEILYTLGNVPLALKHYCRVLELCSDHTRALYGLKLCSSKLHTSDQVDHVKDLELLATERLLEVYKKNQTNKDIRRMLEDFLQPSH